MKTLLAALTLLLTCRSAAQLSGQNPVTHPPGIVDTIFVSGNAKTKDYVILNEMTLKPGMQATPEAIEFDRNRIYSLGLFTHVDIFYDSVGTLRYLFVDVRERWYLVPFPIFGFRDGDPKRAFYGAGLLHNNLGGRNQKLYASLTLGYDPSASLSFIDPLLDRTERLYGAASVSFTRARNKSERESALTGEYNEEHFGISATLGKRLSLYQTAGLMLAYRSVSVPNYSPGRTVSTDGNDKFIAATLMYTYDSRDLFEYASQGILTALSVTQNGFAAHSICYTRYAADVRGYLPLLPRTTLAARLFGSFVTGGEVPTYGHAYFGYGDRIRGYYHDVTEGEQQVLASTELRFSLLPPRTIAVTGLPLPEEFTIWRFGVSLALFADAGTTWYRTETIGVRDFMAGTGGGIHFLLPYSFVARLEYAWNNSHATEWILGLRGAI